MTAYTNNEQNYSFAGYVSICGAISMFIGAAFWGASGTDLWQALANNQMEDYLYDVGSAKPLLVVNTFFWIVGVILLASAGTSMSGFSISRPGLANMGMVIMLAGSAIAIVSFIIMLSLAFYPGTVELASIIGWIGARMDDIATMMIIGYGPLCLSIAGRGDWVPPWLNIWGIMAGFAGLIGLVGLLSSIVPLSFIIIPFGLGWMIAAGVVLIKKTKAN